MSEKIKNIVLSVMFFGVTVFFFLFGIITPDKDLSVSERRKLQKFPQISTNALLKKNFYNDLDVYMTDHFLFRDSFRTLNTVGRLYLLGFKDTNDVYLSDGKLYKSDFPIKPAAVKNASDKINSVKNEYLNNLNVYYSVIPDKNYFGAQETGHLYLDYKEIVSSLSNELEGLTYIPIDDLLTKDDYYDTDLHWKQESIVDIANRLTENMGHSQNKDITDYTYTGLSPFEGAYYGQVALPLKADEMILLSDSTIENCKLRDLITGDEFGFYVTENFANVDPYDVYSGGPLALIEITNENATTDKELYIFRDSFASNLAPLLVESYSKVYLIDLRYISSSLIGDYVSFKEGNDALFLYGSLIINQSHMLK